MWTEQREKSQLDPRKPTPGSGHAGFLKIQQERATFPHLVSSYCLKNVDSETSHSGWGVYPMRPIDWGMNNQKCF